MPILYLGRQDFEKTGVSNGSYLPVIWDHIANSLANLGKGKATAPLDLYLRPGKEGYLDRIIAKTAFLESTEGDGTAISGLKWIASAPLNPSVGLPRANGVVILNDPKTGEVKAILDAAPINALRTAAVSVVALLRLDPNFSKLSIIGAGVIGEEHLRQILNAFKLGLLPELKEIYICDTIQLVSEKLYCKYKPIASEHKLRLEHTTAINHCFSDNTAACVATNALTPYLDETLINRINNLSVIHVSLRDFKASAIACFDTVVVDSWEHVARENTSIDIAHKSGFIQKKDCLELTTYLAGMDNRNISGNIIVNPMGISVTDLTIAELACQVAMVKGIGTYL